jgi:NAD(P)-dependent dehydrogenase (short-subunit alcohol dehydrogenase family)
MVAKALAAGGASKIYILGRRIDRLDAAASQYPSFHPIQCDITSKESLQSAVEFITSNTGHINLLVANSGIVGPMSSFVPGQSISQIRKSMFEDTSMADFANTFEVNVTATYFSILAFLELLDAGNAAAVKGGYGKPTKEGELVPSIQSQVIVTSSVGAFLREWMCPPAYAGSKAAIMHLVKHASTGLSSHGIRVNALAPGCGFPIFSSSLEAPLLTRHNQGFPPRWPTSSSSTEILVPRPWTTLTSSPHAGLEVRRRWVARYCILRAERAAFAMVWCL